MACVPQRSPLRYPGGKTWLVPHIREWLGRKATAPPLLVEPFAGGGIVSLTAVMEGLADRCLMIEIDRDVAAFWRATLLHGPELCERIEKFRPARTAIDALSRRKPDDVLDHGFRTLVLNRTRRGGILAPGAALTRVGENGKGVASRWYPDTIARRICEIARHADRIAFCEGDGVQVLETLLLTRPSGMVVFIDPPYTADGKQAGKRLYSCNDVDHARIFEMLAESDADFLMTYDLSSQIVDLARKYRFHAVQVFMKTTHHNRIPELVITRDAVFES